MYSVDSENPKKYSSVSDALNKLTDEISHKITETETVKVEDCLFRILSEDITAKHNLPLCSTALIDGYAVNSRDIALADTESPVSLKIIKETAEADKCPACKISSGETLKISTGCPLPENADAVVMPEDASVEKGKLKIFKSVLSGENIAKQGEDILKDEVFIIKGRKIRPQDLGGIMGLGYKEVNVYKKPVVGIIPTGDELVSYPEEAECGSLIETNSWVLKGLVDEAGGQPKVYPIVKDNLPKIKAALKKALKETDIVLILGGSSIGSKDFTLKAIEETENSRLIANGIAMRPGRQTLISIINDKAVLGLPGHPVSCLTSFLVFVKPVLIHMTGNHRSFWQDIKDNVKVNAVLSKDVESPKNREDYVRVRLKKLPNGRISAYPYAGKSSLLSTMVKAHGIIKLGVDCSRLYEGDRVEVILF